MALITVNAVVNVSVHIGVVEIVCIIATMAGGALEDRVIIRVDVARGAHTVGVAVINRELRVRVWLNVALVQPAVGAETSGNPPGPAGTPRVASPGLPQGATGARPPVCAS